MTKEKIEISYVVYDDSDELNEQDKWLLKKARETTKQAYAPYSKFRVAAVARLSNGEIVAGTNQENASFPVGLCAERALLGAAANLYPNVPVDVMAISYDFENGTSDQPATPCGVCRQYLQEFEDRHQRPIRLILGGLTGKVFVIEKAGGLLPLAFTGASLK